MASHSRTISESSFELVKTDDETQESVIPKQEEKKENQDVLSLNDDISSGEEASEVDSTDEESSDSSEEGDDVSKLSYEIEKTLPSSGILSGDAVGLTVEIPEEELVMTEEQVEKLVTLSDNKEDLIEAEKTMFKPVKIVSEPVLQPVESSNNKNTPTESGKEEAVIQQTHVEAPKKKEKPVESLVIEKKQGVTKPIVGEKDPLGALEPSVVEQVSQKEKKVENAEDNRLANTSIRPSIETIVMDELSQLRYDMDKYSRTMKAHQEQIATLTKQVTRLQIAENARQEERNPPILVAICGEWQPINMKEYDDGLKRNRVPFPQRWRALMSHVVYDFASNRLSKHSKLCCKTFGRSDVKLGLDMFSEGGHARTTLQNSTLVTVWTDPSGKTEKEERYMDQGKLVVVHTNSYGEKYTRKYERVKNKTDVLYSVGNTCRHYLKIW